MDDSIALMAQCQRAKAACRRSIATLTEPDRWLANERTVGRSRIC